MQNKADAFLAVASDFRLGDLPTEQRHPETLNLAELSRSNIPEALRILQKVDFDSLSAILPKQGELSFLAKAMRETFASGGKVFFYGCGATGRLALSLETLWREKNPGAKADQVIGFMSGGDLALVHSIENFEDHPEFGARQVQEIGFGSNDLLVSCTEGGETPSVIGATEEAARISRRAPWFLYCNPTEILDEKIERSRKVIRNPGIEKICLFAGNMSLSGSTRMQATTILQLAAGWALFAADGEEYNLAELLETGRGVKYSFLEPFVVAESAAYQRKEFLLYETSTYGITVLTDTTERSPTFSLPGFENRNESQPKPALAYLAMRGASDSRSAWNKLLHREPRALEWDVLQGVASARRLMGFDISSQAEKNRQQSTAGALNHKFLVDREGPFMVFRLGSVEHRLDVSGLPLLFEHLLLKLLLNAHSLLVMGRLNRFESNVMTWVRPSNNKLIDRAIRYVNFLLEKEVGRAFPYEEVCRQLFTEVERLQEGESVVLKTVKSLSGRAGKSKGDPFRALLLL